VHVTLLSPFFTLNTLMQRQIGVVSNITLRFHP
jgi:hypothetical protein